MRERRHQAEEASRAHSAMIEAVALEEAAAAATASTCFASDGPRLTLSFRGSSGGQPLELS